MPYIFDRDNFFLGMFGAVPVLGILAYLGRALTVERLGKYIDRRVDHQFNQELERSKGEITKEVETHKGELTRLGDRIKYEQQRELQNYNLYTIKRHEVYAELFQHLHAATSDLFEWENVLHGPAAVFAYPTRSAAESFLNDYLDAKEYGPSISLNEWDNYTPKQHANWVKDCATALYALRADKKKVDARRYINSHLFYLTPQIESLARQSIAVIQSCITALRDAPTDTEYRIPSEAIDDKIADLRDAMRAELGGRGSAHAP